MSDDRDPVSLGLPHRAPFIFIDAVSDRVPGEFAAAVKTFPRQTAFFEGHFPGQPMVPGVIIAEALAQTAGIAAGHPGAQFRLTAIKAMKFLGAVLPSEEIHLFAKKIAVVGTLWQFETRAMVGERVVAEGVIVLSELHA